MPRNANPKLGLQGLPCARGPGLGGPHSPGNGRQGLSGLWGRSGGNREQPPHSKPSQKLPPLGVSSQGTISPQLAWDFPGFNTESPRRRWTVGPLGSKQTLPGPGSGPLAAVGVEEGLRAVRACLRPPGPAPPGPPPPHQQGTAGTGPRGPEDHFVKEPPRKVNLG